MTLKEAIEMLTIRYTYASSQKWCNNPLAWALYQTWKEADRCEFFKEAHGDADRDPAQPGSFHRSTVLLSDHGEQR